MTTHLSSFSSCRRVTQETERGRSPEVNPRQSREIQIDLKVPRTDEQWQNNTRSIESMERIVTDAIKVTKRERELSNSQAGNQREQIVFQIQREQIAGLPNRLREGPSQVISLKVKLFGTPIHSRNAMDPCDVS
jgi:hypothetical protein